MEFEELPLGRGLKLVNQFSVRKTASMWSGTFKGFKPFMENLVGIPQDDIVPVYSFNIIDVNDVKATYSYDMKRLYPLTSLERCIVESSWGNLGEAWEDKSANLVLCKKENKKLYEFLQRLIFTLKYRDIHGGNIMKDKDGNYLAIDIEGFFH